MKRQGLAENQFCIVYLGRSFPFCRQNARQRLTIGARAAELVPRLLRYGLGSEEARALAYNCVLLWQTLAGADAPASPETVLELFTLGQIAALCERYWQENDVDFGEWQEGGRLETEEML